MGKPYIVPDSWTKTTTQASGATYAITLPSGIVAGDYIGVWIVQDGAGATAITESGASAFTFLGTQATTGALRTAYCFDASATGGGSDVLTVACNSAAIWAVTFLVRGHHASPHGGSPASGTDFVYSMATTISASGTQAGVMTTADANTLNMYFVGMDGDSTSFRCAAGDATVPIVFYSTVLSGAAGYNPATSTTAVRPTFYASHSGEGIQIFSLAIRWDGITDCGQAYCDPNLVELDWLSGISPNNPGMNPTWAAIDSTTIDSLATSAATTVTEAYSAIVNPDTVLPWETLKTLSSNVNMGAEGWIGRKMSFGAAKDLTNHILNVTWRADHSTTAAHVGAKGIAIRLTDGTNWVAYTLEAKAEFATSVMKNAQIELGVATALDSSGTVATALAGVTAVEFMWHRTAGVTTAATFYFGNLVAFDRDVPATIRGGGAKSPASAIDYANALQSWNQYRLVNLQSKSQVMARGPLQIGDGTNATYWDSNAGSLATPKEYNGTTQNFWRVGNSKVGLYIKAATGDTIKLRAGSAVFPGLQIFAEQSGSSITSVTRDFTGQVFVGAAPTLIAGATYANATFSGCDPVNTKGATLTNITVNNTLAGSGEAAVVVDTTGSTLTSCSIDCTQDVSLGSVSSYHLETGTAVTAITLTDVTFSGTPGTDKVHVLATTGTVTINISGTTSLSAGDVTSAGATVSIVSTPLYQSVTINGVAAGYRVQIYDTTSSTELSNAIAAGTSVTWNDGSVAAADRAIRVRIAYKNGATAKQFIEANIGTCGQTSGTKSVSYLANVVNDTVYNNNAIDGSAVSGVTFTDAATDVININVAAATISWKSIYAAWVAYAFTATGIATDIDYIDAVDEANYLLSNLVVKNTSSPSVPLEITGGYARDATTLAAIDLIDTTGGTIVVAPDHVVSYATGSGLTAGQDAKLTAIDAVCTTFNFTSGSVQADIQRVNGYEVTGDGQTGTEWGPV